MSNSRQVFKRDHRLRCRAAYLLAMALYMPLPGYTTPLDEIAVVVNNEVIMQSEIAQRARLLSNSEEQARQLSAQELLQVASDQLIMERLQIQFARRNNLSVDDATLDAAMQQLARQNNMNLTTFQAALKRRGIDYLQFRAQTRNKILLDNLRKRQARQSIDVSNQEVNELIRAQSLSQAADTRYQLEHILLTAPNGTAIPQLNRIRQQAENLRRQILAGESSFQSVADKTPDHQKIYQGWQNADALPAPIARALALLEPGELSAVVRDPQGFHLFRLLQRQGGKSLQQDKQLRNQASNFLGERKLDEYYRAWLQSLRNGAYIDYRLGNPEPGSDQE